MANTGRGQSTLVTITNIWRYNQTEALAGTNWTLPNFDDSGWPSGPALLYVEDNAAVSPRNTALTDGRTTYYFRAQFNFSGTPALPVLTFSNRVDDGAVFYLNGNEIQRLRMAAVPATIDYATLASSLPPGGDATAWDVFSIPATNLLVGQNTLAVEVHQQATNSSDIVFGSALSLGNPSVVRGPHLQSGTPASVVVRWRTDLVTDSVVRFSTNLSNLNGQVGDAVSTIEHEVMLSGLVPGTKYFYSVGSSAGPIAGGDTNFFFVTSPVPGTPKPTRIWVIGDAGTADGNQAAVRNAYYNFTGTRHTDLWLMLGDNAYNGGTDLEYQSAVFNVYQTMLRKSVLWSTLGNHETDQSPVFTNSYPYFNIFTLPTNGIAGGLASASEHYYSFDYANIHFVCLDSMTADTAQNRQTNGPMATWLRADLLSTTNTWLIAFWHHPPYTKGSHNSDTEVELIEMRQNFLPILESAGVDLVLSGHSHCYERSYLIDGHYGLSTNLSAKMVLNGGSGRETNALGAYTKWASGPQSHQGTVYAVAGSSGKISGGTLNHPAMFVSLNLLGSLVLDVDGDRLDAKFIRENGATNDQFTIVKRDV